MTADPLALLAHLLPGVPGRDGYFPVMALATVDSHGDPDVRTVLLSEITDIGTTFHTDGRSRKAAQLARLPAVALMLTIPEQARQIVIHGQATPQSDPQSAAAYHARSRYLQLLAWLNTPEMAILPEDERRRRWAEFAAGHPDGTLLAPAEWRGFVVRPTRITFWHGDVEGPSHRVEYTRTDTGWSATEMAG